MLKGNKRELVIRIRKSVLPLDNYDETYIVSEWLGVQVQSIMTNSLAIRLQGPPPFQFANALPVAVYRKRLCAEDSDVLVHGWSASSDRTKLKKIRYWKDLQSGLGNFRSKLDN